MVSAAPRSGIDLLLDAASTGEGRPPCAELLGWEPIGIEPGRVRVRFAARDAFCNGMGNIQGGFLAAMLDDAMGPALFTLLDDEQFAPTLEIKVSFLRPARPGTIIAEGRVVRAGRSVAFLEGTLATEEGELIATGSATARILTAVVNG
jgi:uncharacterized protein (TIGR00369 family)